MPEPFIITLDGPAGVGKSTIAAELALRLGLPVLDTGAMFRFFALKAGENGPDLSDATLREISRGWKFSLQGTGPGSLLSCNGAPLGSELRTPRVAMLASSLATRKTVRDILLQAQRCLAHETGLVAGGRDMGTVVFPSAQCKFFLDARPEVRAMRRWLQMNRQGDLKALTEEIARRDAQDRERKLAPLRPASDAMVVDTSDLSQQEVLNRLLKEAQARRH